MTPLQVHPRQDEELWNLFELVDGVERSMKAGRLDNVAPGEPVVNERDLTSFLNANASGATLG